MQCGTIQNKIEHYLMWSRCRNDKENVRDNTLNVVKMCASQIKSFKKKDGNARNPEKKLCYVLILIHA